MRSLWFKLLSVFALVILVGTAVDSLLINRITGDRFDRYVSQSGQMWAEQLAPVLVRYYVGTNSWQGADALLANPWAGSMGGMAAFTLPNGEGSSWMGHGMGGMMGPGMMAHDDWEMGPGMMMDGEMWSRMGFHLLLADAQGTVVAASVPEWMGTTLRTLELEAGTPVIVDDRRVGTLLAVTALADATTPAADFLAVVNRATWVSGLIAAGVALGLGLLLFRQIVAPIQALTTAARRMAAGDLDQRVDVRSADEIGQLAEAFNGMADALAKDQQLRRTLIADVAHELRTPLSVIQANLEAMLDGVLLATPEEIASLHDETRLLTRLVADLRLLSLAEAGQLRLERSQVDLADLIRRVVEPLHLQAESASVTLTVDLPAALPPVLGDADRIGQVVGNLVNNALRYMPGGGEVAVRASTSVNESQGEAEVVVTVSDTGSGIAPQDLPHVFDRFYRADKSRSRRSGGSGIGLAIVKQLVEAHGGRVWAESDLGRGTTFAFSLPGRQL